MNTHKSTAKSPLALALGLAFTTLAPVALAGDGVAAGGRAALAQIKAELAAAPTGAERAATLREAMAGARVIPGLESLRVQGTIAVADIRAALMQDMLKTPPAAVYPDTLITRRVAAGRGAGPTTDVTPGNWELPELDIKPLLDPTVLFFSFER